MATDSAEFEVKMEEADYEEFVQNLYESQQSSEFTDFKIRINEKTIYCHKVVLAAKCPYFKTLLLSKMIETKEGEVTLDTSMNYDVVTAIIGYIYNQKFSLKWNQVQDAIIVSDYLQLNQLKKQLCKYMMKFIDCDNCIRLWKFAIKFCLVEVQKKVEYILLTQLDKVALSDEFKALSLEELVECIKCPDIANRDPILHAALQWINVDAESRKKDMLEILRCIRLNECSSSIIKAVTTNYKNLFVDPSVIRLMYDEILPRLEDDNKQLIVLGGMQHFNYNVNTTCWVTEPFSGNWKRILTIPEGYQKSQSPIVVIPNGFVVMCGGGSLKANSMYDMKNKTWNSLPDTPRRIRNATGLYSNGSIFLLGGEAKGNLNTVYQFCLENRKWSENPNMLESHRWPIAASVGHYIYVVYNDETGTKIPITFQQLKVGSLQWKFKCSLPNEVSCSDSSSLIGIDPCLYLVGGRYGLCECYNIATDAWTSLQKPKNIHEGGSLFHYNRRLYLLGSNYGNLDIEQFNIDEGKWETAIFSLPKKLCWFGMALIPQTWLC